VYPRREEKEEKEEEGGEEELVYDGAGIGKGKERVTIMETDLERLDSGVWLNDNLVDLWFKMVAMSDPKVEGFLDVVDDESSGNEYEVVESSADEIQIVECEKKEEKQSKKKKKKKKKEDERNTSLGSSSSESEDTNSIDSIWANSKPKASSPPQSSSPELKLTPVKTLPHSPRPTSPFLSRSSYHCFTSHFFTTLSNSKYAGVKSWIKDIKSFLNLKYVFVPICKDMHWSLCVIVNPGAYFMSDGTVSEEKVNRAGRILSDYKNTLDDAVDEEEDEKAPGSCILFFDSLRCHSSKGIATKIRQYMSEMMKEMLKKAKGRDALLDEIYKKNSKIFPVLEPAGIPYQTNGCDCGVFTSLYFSQFGKVMADEEVSLMWIKNFKSQKSKGSVRRGSSPSSQGSDRSRGSSVSKGRGSQDIFKKENLGFTQQFGVPQWREKMKAVCGVLTVEHA